MSEPFGTAAGSTRTHGAGGMQYCKRCGHTGYDHPNSGKCTVCPSCKKFESEHNHNETH